MLSRPRPRITMTLRAWFLPLAFAWCFVVSFPSARAQEPASNPQYDVVEFRRDAASPKQILAGIIQSVDQQHVQIDLGTNGTRRVPREQVLKLELNSRPELVAARQLAQRGQFQRAADAWQEIARNQREPWLRQHAQIQCCHCQTASGQNLSALSTFAALVRDAPESPPWQAAPLNWTTSRPDPILEKQIAPWLEDANPIRQLLAGSLMLTVPAQTQRAQLALKQLTQHQDPDIAGLATAQLWRTQTTASAADLAQRESAIENLPGDLQAGPRLVLGRLMKSANDDRAAVVQFLKVATLYPEQHALVLLGLDQAYLTLKGLGDPQAETVGQWLKQRFPDSSAAMAVEF